MYSQEASESEIGQGLAQRHDAVMNFISSGGRFGRDEPLSMLAARTNYFRESYAYGDDGPHRRHRAVPAPSTASSPRRAPCTAGR